jgi:hypothetical protein
VTEFRYFGAIITNQKQHSGTNYHQIKIRESSSEIPYLSLAPKDVQIKVQKHAAVLHVTVYSEQKITQYQKECGREPICFAL